MNPGLVFSPDSRVRGHALPLSVVIVTLVFFAAGRPLAASEAAGEDAVIRPPLMAIATAFRALQPEGLTPLLPPESKVFMAMESFQGSAGYYGRDQVYLILQKAFRDLKTVRFEIQLQRNSSKAGSGGSGQVAHCVGTWTYSRRESPEVTTRLHFLLTSRDGKWSLIQIREAR
jgi:hypothetical protein